ncbi:hypothetical protein BH09ACT2_BH09ACT2_08350 [soil metagenome]
MVFLGDGEGGRTLGHSYDQLYVALTPTQSERWAAAKDGQ